MSTADRKQPQLMVITTNQLEAMSREFGDVTLTYNHKSGWHVGLLYSKGGSSHQSHSAWDHDLGEAVQELWHAVGKPE